MLESVLRSTRIALVGRTHRLPVGLAIALGFVPVVAFAQEPRAPQVAPSALAQIAALEAVKKAQTPEQEKLDSRLHLAILNDRRDASVSSLTDFRFVKPDRDGRVAVDIILTSASGMKPVLQRIEDSGGIVESTHKGYRLVAARMSLSSLEDLAAMTEVLRVRQRIPYYHNAINTSEGDLTHGAALARGLYSTTGAGIKIGVISDGVDSLAALQASDDLPPFVDVLPGQAGAGDEGSAMLEIVHDLAPDADLAFATADPTMAQFAQNILDLAAAGCDIIVDDILYLAESPFQDGPIAQAVNTVTAAGVLYFSSAGNEGNANDLTSGTWEGDFLPNGTPAALAGAGPVHDFGDGGQSILVQDAFLDPPLLIWAEHYDLPTGLASTDFDLYVMNATLTTIFDASTDVQDGVGGDDFPIEFVGGGTFTGERLVVAQFAAGTTSSVPMFNLIVVRGELDDALATGGATRGHNSAADAFSTAATPAADSFDGITPDGPYPGEFTAANESESFTSDGPRRIILTPAGAEITPGNRTSTGGVVRQKPDITAADGVSTAAPGFSTFYGTSAAAPHAAAIAALLKSAVPSLTPAQIRTHLLSTAIDIEIPGTDRDTGAGIVMPVAALEDAGATSVAFLDAGTAVPTQAIGDGDAFLESNEVFNLTIPLENLGTTAATGVSGVLTTSTPGVTINNGNSAYPDIAGAATENNTTPFTFTIGPSIACGTSIDFVLTVTYTGPSSPQAFPFSFRVGEAGAPQTFTYAGPVVPIGDAGDLTGTNPGPVAIASLLAAGFPAVWDLDFRFDGTACSNAATSTTVGLKHTFVSDLRITLRSPGGTTVLMGNEPDGSGNNFCQTVLDDEGGGPPIQSALSASAPFTGTFTPNAPLSALHGANGNGTWQLEVQDFFSGDTGDIRSFSLVGTPAVCNAPPLQANVSGTKTVAGTFSVGGTVTYTVTLTNTGGLAQADNGTNEFVDALPPDLTLVGAVATSGTAVPNVGTNTVTWNGSLAPLGGSVTITITATVDAVPLGTVISNQGSIHYDTEGNGSNEASRLTDDPGVGGASDPTSFTVAGVVVTATKTTNAGPFAVGSNVVYTVTLTNTGNVAQADNAGAEFTDVLPADITLVSVNATSGTAVANIPANTVTWNGALPASGSVTIIIVAIIDNVPAGTVVSNQGTISYDSEGNGSNEAAGLTDDPGVGGTSDPTSFTVSGGATISATKTATGAFTVGSTVTYTITLTNTGNAPQGDNPGDELTDVLPASLGLLSANASSGIATASVATNTVTWNGTIPIAGSVTITITANIESAPPGTTITNQGLVSYDSNNDAINDATSSTDDPGQPGASDATSFGVVGVEIPTLGAYGFAALIGLLAFAALVFLRRQMM